MVLRVIKRYSPFLLVVAFVNGCGDFKEPEARDATSIIGCYTAPDAPTFVVQAKVVKFAKDGTMVSFRYEFRTVGTVLRMPMVAETVDGQFDFTPADDHFYRVLHTDAGPIVRVAFGPDGTIVDYKRKSPGECAR